MKNRKLALLGIFFTLLLAKPALAFTEGACKADEDKYCKGKPLIGGQMKKCMEEHMDQLSQACKANILEMAVKAKEAKSGNN